MKKQITIVRLTNGKYVKNWQYSQGHFEVGETEDIFQACPISRKNFSTHFGEKGHTFLFIELKATIVPMRYKARKSPDITSDILPSADECFEGYYEK